MVSACAVGLTPPGVAAAGPAQDGVVYSTFAGRDGISTLGHLWFLDEVSKRSNGKFKVKNAFFNGALLKGTEQIEGLSTGIADVGYVCPGYDTARFPLASTAEMPFLTEKGDALAAALNELYETHAPLKEEFRRNNLELLGFESSSPMIIGIGKGRTLDKATDLQGLKLRAWGANAEVLKSAGNIVPVVVEPSEITTAMQTGTIDGYAAQALWGPAAFNYLPMTGTIVSPGYGTYYVCTISMNLDTYNSLDDEVKKVIADVRKQFPQKTIELTAEGDKTTVEQATAANVKFYKFSPEEVTAWKNRLNIDQYLKSWNVSRQKYTKANVGDFSERVIQSVRKHELRSTYTQAFPK
jgi:TRAP-type C4-dicarboxylate transport system substrate-binding protein